MTAHITKRIQGGRRQIINKQNEMKETTVAVMRPAFSGLPVIH
jgi:hypothetical protein